MPVRPIHPVKPTKFRSRLEINSGEAAYTLYPESLIVRELRHQTKNALQHVLGMIEEASELQGTASARALSEALQQRILLAVQISDCLFGLTCRPGSLQTRIQFMSEAVIDLLKQRNAKVHLEIEFDGEPPEYLQQTLLRVAHEYVANAVKHGMKDRGCGRIAVRLQVQSDQVLLTVTDDAGYFEPGKFKVGEGLSLISEIVDEHGGSADLRRIGGHTVAGICIPVVERIHHLSLCR